MFAATAGRQHGAPPFSAGDACAWVGMSSAGAYALAKREPGFAAAWDAALTARHGDRRPIAAKPIDALSNAELMRPAAQLRGETREPPAGHRRATK